MKLFSATASALVSVVVIGKVNLAAAQVWRVKSEIFPNDPPGSPSSITSPDYGFAWQVALSGDTALVGSFGSGKYNRNVESNGSGSARVFIRTNPTSSISWDQQAVLVANDGNSGEYIGYTVAIDGDTALVGAFRHDGNGVPSVARVFVFVRSGATWTQEVMLHLDDVYVDDGRAPRVALEGDTAVVGRGYGGKGKVFVYTRSGTTWTESAILEASDGLDGSYFGADVAISGNTILVGASERGQLPQFQKGKAYVFVGGGATWMEEEIILPDGANLSDQMRFGDAVALDADTAIIGHEDTGDAGADPQIFVRNAGSWTLQAKLPTENNSRIWSRNFFGMSVDVKGDLALVGTLYLTSYLYARTGTTWQKVQVLTGTNDAFGGNWYFNDIPIYGKAIALDGGDTVLVGADNLNDVGKVQVFDNFTPLPPGPWDITYVITRFDDDQVTRTQILTIEYNIGFGREFEAQLLGEDCQTPITGTPIDPVQVVRDTYSLTHDTLKLTYILDLNTIAASSIYSSTCEIAFCHVLNLITPGTPNTIEATNEKTLTYDIVPTPEQPGPWGITSGFADAINGELYMVYDVGHDREFESEIFEKDCQTPVTGTVISAPLFTREIISLTQDRLRLTYIFDSSTIAASNIFNTVTWEIEFCHVLNLITPGTPDVIEATDEHNDVYGVNDGFVPTPNGWGSGIFGDPHLLTFDQLNFDCQAAGEFVTLTSLQDPTFQIQERFSSADSDSCTQASVSTGIAFKDTNKPTIQMSTPKTGQTALNTIVAGGTLCPIDFYVDGVASTLGSILSSNILVDKDGPRVLLAHTDTLLKVEVTVEHSDTFGCHFLVQLAIPETFRPGETILGLLGTPNGDAEDDWRAPNGDIIAAPMSDEERIFGTAYEYCVDNWCISDSADSLFSYGGSETFENIYKCDTPYSNDIELAVADPSEELANICGTDLFCLVDGLCGDLSDAAMALDSEATIIAIQESIGFTPSPTTTSAPTLIPTVPNPWYADGETGTTSCLNDGNQPEYMNSDPNWWLYLTCEDCCQERSNWALQECLNNCSGNGGDPSSKYFADYASGSCLKDCAPGPFGCAIVPPPVALYDSIDICCSVGQPWVDSLYCNSRSVDSYTNGWVVDYKTETCAKDCEPGSEPPCLVPEHKDFFAKIFSNSRECCETHLGWIDLDTCVAHSERISPSDGSNKYFADYASGSCLKDCAPGPFGCAIVPPPVVLYDSIDVCCSIGQPWVDSLYCNSRSIGSYTNGWVVDYALEKCAKDCKPDSGSPCSDVSDFYTPIYDTVQECCGLLSWIDQGKCVSVSNSSQ